MAFSSIVRLKDGSYAGVFHRGKDPAKNQNDLEVVQSISRDGGFTWSDPEVVAYVKGKDLCEPYVFRSPEGSELCTIIRDNQRTGTSMVMFSQNEGKTWSAPVDTPWGLTGDRHQGIQLPDGRLVIVFRDFAPGSPSHTKFVAWIGTYAYVAYVYIYVDFVYYDLLSYLRMDRYLVYNKYVYTKCVYVICIQ
jgi:hypothetical protein